MDNENDERDKKLAEEKQKLNEALNKVKKPKRANSSNSSNIATTTTTTSSSPSSGCAMEVTYLKNQISICDKISLF